MKSGIDVSFIDKIKQHNDIVSIVSRNVPLNRKGRIHWGCCPFHYEKTPSFAVYGEEGYYHCYGCGESGDVIKFVQKQDNCDFITSLEILAKNAGIEMPVSVFDAEIGKLKKRKEQIFKINREAAVFYNKCLFSEEGAKALSYLTGRGLSRSTIIKFGLGLSPGWQQAIKHLQGAGFSKEDIIASGVADEKNGRTYDAFAERIMFPLINTFGDVVGFSGRTMKKESDIAKYKNTRETIIFDKSSCIYGLNNIKSLRKKQPVNEIILVEGQMDVIKLYEKGVLNAVACLGTALTKNHAKELKRFSEKIYVCFDGDEAGQKAALKSLDILADEGLNVRVASLTNKLDPDEYVSKFGKNGFLKLLENGESVIDYKLRVLSLKYNLENNFEKAKFIKEALNVLNNQPTNIDKEIYIETLHKLSGVQLDVLRRELNLTFNQENKSIKKTERAKPINVKDGYIEACKFYLAALLHKKTYANEVEDEYFYFIDSELTKLYNLAKNKAIISTLFDEFDVENSSIIKEIISYNFNFSDIASEEKYYFGSIRKILLKNLLVKKDKINEEFQATKNPFVLNELKDIDKKINLIKAEEN